MKSSKWFRILPTGLVVLLASSVIACSAEPSPAPPLILAFDATPAQVNAGESTTLRWVVKEPDSVNIDQGIGSVAAVGKREVSPTTTIAYTLTAINTAGTVSKSVVITVSAAPSPPPDSTPPVITSVSVSSETESSAVISWTTNEPASSQVDYGRSTDYGSTTNLYRELVTSHSVTISGLEPNTTYHFQVKSKDKAKNKALSGDYVFATVAPKSSYVLELLWSEWGRRVETTMMSEIPYLFVKGTVRNASRASMRGMACVMQCWSGDRVVKSEVYVYRGNILPGHHYEFDIQTADDPSVDNVSIEFTDSLGREITLIVK